MSIIEKLLELELCNYKNDFTSARNSNVSDELPPVTSPMIILADNEEPMIVSGGKRNRDTIKGLYNVILPSVKRGDCKLLIVWQGMYRTDIIELKPDSVDAYLAYIKDYADKNWVNSFL